MSTPGLTLPEAKDELEKAMEEVDNPVGASRALTRVASKLRPHAPKSTWDAFTFAAEKALEPWFGENTKAVVWPLLDSVDRWVQRADEEELPRAVSALEPDPPDPPSFIVNGLLLDREIHLLVSAGGEGKTTLALEIAAAVAGGNNLFEHPDFAVTAPGPVLFISEEDGLGVLQNRLVAIIKGHGWDAESVLGKVHLLAQEGASLDSATWQLHILQEIERIGTRLVVFDPLAELTLAAENSNDEMKPIVRFFRKITATTKASVLVLHHAGKAVQGKRKLDRIRGASSVNAAARAIYFLERCDIGLGVECLKLNRGEIPPKFVVKRDIESDPENPAVWTSARFTYVSQVEAEDEAAERFVLHHLTRRGTLNTTELKDVAKGSGVAAVDISKALKNLSAVGQIGYQKGPKNSKRWHLTPLAEESRQPRQPDLPSLPEVAGQTEEATPVVASPIREATGASTGEQSGQPRPHPAVTTLAAGGAG